MCANSNILLAAISTVEKLILIRGEFGTAHHNGKPVLLGEGIHVYNTRIFAFDKFVNVDQQYLSHGSIRIYRLLPAAYLTRHRASSTRILWIRHRKRRSKGKICFISNRFSLV